MATSEDTAGAPQGDKVNAAAGQVGVYWVAGKGKWRTMVYVTGRALHVGYYTRKEDAKLAYDAALYTVNGRWASRDRELTCKPYRTCKASRGCARCATACRRCRQECAATDTAQGQPSRQREWRVRRERLVRPAYSFLVHVTRTQLTSAYICAVKANAWASAFISTCRQGLCFGDPWA